MARGELAGDVEKRRVPRFDRRAIQVAREILRKRVRRRVALFRGAMAGADGDGIQVAAQGAPPVIRRTHVARRCRLAGPQRWRLGDDPENFLEWFSGDVVRSRSGQQLEHQHAEPEDVGGDRHVGSAQLLRARIVGRERPGPSRHGGRFQGGWRFEKGRDAEIEHLRDPVRRHQHVCRFQIAVHDEMRVRVVHRIADLAEQPQSIVNGERAIAAVHSDRHTVHEFHDQVGLATVRETGVEQADDVRMVQRGEDLALGQESTFDVLVGNLRRDDFDRHLLLEGAVGAFRPVNDPHPARRDQFDEFELPDHVAFAQRWRANRIAGHRRMVHEVFGTVVRRE